MNIKFENDQKILAYYLPKFRKRLRYITKIDMTYVPPSVLRDINKIPYAITFDTTDDNHYYYDISKNRLTDVRSLQWP